MENKNLTLGSLFDGSGGFPLGGLLCGITPVWASEIEPFPIRVTTKRLPFMKHYGDISQMDGGKIKPVDIITFGSPCTDMSVAGKRAGLDGQQSVLFYQAIRIIKEIRCATNGRYPRYIVWENVPGAFSSNKGEDFKAVLDAVIGVKEPDASVPMPEKNLWPYADLYMGDGWSLAYRTLDAQHWGVPQRRKRIYLVADFAGGSAGQILFESEGLSGYSAESFRAWQRATGSAAACTGAAGIGLDGYNGAVSDQAATLGVNCGMSTGRNGVVLNDQGGSRMDVTEDVTCTLRAEAHHPPCVMDAAGFCTEHSAKSRSIGFEEEKSPTLRAGVVPATVYENHSQDTRYTGPLEVAPTVSSTYGTGGNNQPFVVKKDAPKTLKIRNMGSPKSRKTFWGEDEQRRERAFRACTETSDTELARTSEGGGKGALIQEEKSATLSCNNDQTLFVPFCKGTRPHSKEEAQQWKDGKIANTLNTFDVGEQRCNELVVKAYGISSDQSHAMLSGNPHSGVYEADTSRTIDANGGNPGCNQGGIAVVESYAIQGSMIGREDKNGPQGDGVNENVSFTLNTVDRHAVYAMTTGSYMQTTENQSPTLMARDFKDPAAIAYGIGRDAFNQGRNAKFTPSVEDELQPTLVAKGCGCPVDTSAEGRSTDRAGRRDPGAVQSGYTVRRLTPTECARLQGFPDWWCSDLGTPEPTMEDIRFWYSVFETHRRVTGSAAKPRTLKQIAKWLKDPYTDAAEYKMWGNGVALPCVYFVLAGIVLSTQLSPQ